MPKALILLADGSEEIEFVTPYDGIIPPNHFIDRFARLPENCRWLANGRTVLTRAGFEVKSAGVHLKNEGYAQCVVLYPKPPFHSSSMLTLDAA